MPVLDLAEFPNGHGSMYASLIGQVITISYSPRQSFILQSYCMVFEWGNPICYCRSIPGRFTFEAGICDSLAMVGFTVRRYPLVSQTWYHDIPVNLGWLILYGHTLRATGNGGRIQINRFDRFIKSINISEWLVGLGQD